MHRTTRAVPDKLWRAERDFLIRLPEARFTTCDEELRAVGPDATLMIRGTPTPCRPDPDRLGGRLEAAMKRLAHIHLRSLWRLAEHYGDPASVPVDQLTE